MLTATTTRPQRVLLWLAPVLITIAMLGFAAAAASDPRVPGPIWILGLIAVAVGWWSYMSIPRRIVVTGADLLLERGQLFDPAHGQQSPLAVAAEP